VSGRCGTGNVAASPPRPPGQAGQRRSGQDSRADRPLHRSPRLLPDLHPRSTGRTQGKPGQDLRRSIDHGRGVPGDAVPHTAPTRVLPRRAATAHRRGRWPARTDGLPPSLAADRGLSRRGPLLSSRNDGPSGSRRADEPRLAATPDHHRQRDEPRRAVSPRPVNRGSSQLHRNDAPTPLMPTTLLTSAPRRPRILISLHQTRQTARCGEGQSSRGELRSACGNALTGETTG
jgi:hypothetical protein